MNIVVIGMGYVGIPCAVLLADVPGLNVIGVQRRSERSGWKIECLNNGNSPFEGDEPGLAELIARVTLMPLFDFALLFLATVVSIHPPRGHRHLRW